MSKAELKPCPFCGGEARIVSTEPRLYRHSRNGKYAVACYGCEIYLGYDEDYGCQFDTKEEAIEAWNTRESEAEIRASAVDEFAERLRNICDKHPIGHDYKTQRLLYGHEDGTWHDLIEYVAEQMKESEKHGKM